MDNERMENHVMTTCACGCGHAPNAGKRYVRGHHARKHPHDQAPSAQRCACGCGDLAKPGSRYLRGHHTRKSPVEYLEEDRGYKTPCWIWQRATTADGLGHNGTRSARRVVYERERGPIPDGHTLEAQCKVAACVHPDHMDVITRGEALRQRGLHKPGPRAKRATCKRGHPWTPENTKLIPGGRQCRTCSQETQRAYYLRKQAEYRAGPPATPPSLSDPPDTLKRCKQGHLIAGENASPSGAGRFRCRICVNAAALAGYYRRQGRGDSPAG